MHSAIGGLIADEGFVAGQVHELSRLELLAEFTIEMFSIGKADAEGDEGADVSKDGISHGGGDLGDVLMTQGEVEPILSGLSQDGGEGLRGEVLELIHEEIEVASRVLGLAISGHGG